MVQQYPWNRIEERVERLTGHFDDAEEALLTSPPMLPIPLPPNRPVTVAELYANPLDPTSLPLVKAFAKLAGHDWTYYVTTVNICIGRGCEQHTSFSLPSYPPYLCNLPDSSSDSLTANSIDVDLGPAKTVSRRHANILYNFETSRWELTIHGRNGLKVDYRPYKPSIKNIPLQSGNLIEVGGVQFLFLLPTTEDEEKQQTENREFLKELDEEEQFLSIPLCAQPLSHKRKKEKSNKTFNSLNEISLIDTSSSSSKRGKPSKRQKTASTKITSASHMAPLPLAPLLTQNFSTTSTSTVMSSPSKIPKSRKKRAPRGKALNHDVEAIQISSHSLLPDFEEENEEDIKVDDDVFSSIPFLLHSSPRSLNSSPPLNIETNSTIFNPEVSASSLNFSTSIPLSILEAQTTSSLEHKIKPAEIAFPLCPNSGELLSVKEPCVNAPLTPPPSGKSGIQKSVLLRSFSMPISKSSFAIDSNPNDGLKSNLAPLLISQSMLNDPRIAPFSTNSCGSPTSSTNSMPITHSSDPPLSFASAISGTNSSSPLLTKPSVLQKLSPPNSAATSFQPDEAHLLSDDPIPEFLRNRTFDYSGDETKGIKPPYSYATLIAESIYNSPHKAASLSEIYQYISEHYAFYRHAKHSWQNSVRHNLSLGRAFQKIMRPPSIAGKGCLWRIDPEYAHELTEESKQVKRKFSDLCTSSQPVGSSKEILSTVPSSSSRSPSIMRSALNPLTSPASVKEGHHSPDSQCDPFSPSSLPPSPSSPPISEFGHVAASTIASSASTHKKTGFIPSSNSTLDSSNCFTPKNKHPTSFISGSYPKSVLHSHSLTSSAGAPSTGSLFSSTLPRYTAIFSSASATALSNSYYLSSLYSNPTSTTPTAKASNLPEFLLPCPPSYFSAPSIPYPCKWSPFLYSPYTPLPSTSAASTTSFSTISSTSFSSTSLACFPSSSFQSNLTGKSLSTVSPTAVKERSNTSSVSSASTSSLASASLFSPASSAPSTSTTSTTSSYFFHSALSAQPTPYRAFYSLYHTTPDLACMPTPAGLMRSLPKIFKTFHQMEAAPNSFSFMELDLLDKDVFPWIGKLINRSRDAAAPTGGLPNPSINASATPSCNTAATTTTTSSTTTNYTLSASTPLSPSSMYSTQSPTSSASSTLGTSKVKQDGKVPFASNQLKDPTYRASPKASITSMQWSAPSSSSTTPTPPRVFSSVSTSPPSYLYPYYAYAGYGVAGYYARLYAQQRQAEWGVGLPFPSSSTSSITASSSATAASSSILFSGANSNTFNKPTAPTAPTSSATRESTATPPIYAL